MPSPSYWKSDVPNPSQSLLRNVPEGRCDRSLARSAWDSATPKEPSRRVRCDSCRCAHRFDDWSDGILNTKTENIYVLCFLAYDTILSMANTFSCLNIQVQETVHYIEQQLEHHRTRTFQEEYLAFLKKHGAHFDEKYLWD